MGKHVASSVRQAGAGPRDLSAALARHRARGDAGPTEPPGGYPATVGADPGPAAAGKSPDNGQVLSSPTGSAWSTANTWHPKVPGGSAGY